MVSRKDKLALLRERVDTMRRLVAGDGSSCQHQTGLADALHKLNHARTGSTLFTEAEAEYRLALQKCAGASLLHEMSLRVNLGSLLMSASRIDEAISEFDILLQHERTPGGEDLSALMPGAHFNRGKALDIAGRRAEAQDAYLAALAAARGTDSTTFGKAAAALRRVPDHLVAEIEQMVAAAPLSVSDGEGDMEPNQAHQDRSWLEFTLFSHYDSIGSHDEAWRHLLLANALQRGVEPYNRQKETTTANTLLSMFNEPFGPAGSPDSSTIFIVGFPRAGSTLVEQILASHSRVWGGGEDTAFAPMLGELFSGLAQVPANLKHEFLSHHGQRYVHEMRTRVPADWQPAPTKIVDKMLRNSWNVGFIYLTLPNSCLVHVVRHPLDVGFSCFAQPFEGRGTPWAWRLDDIAHQMNLTLNLMQHWKKMLPGKILTVYYEELVHEQQEVSARILNHCGLAWEDDVLKFYSSTRRRQVHTASMAQVRSPMYRTAIARWWPYREKMHAFAQQLQPHIEDHQRELIRRGVPYPHFFGSSEVEQDATASATTRDVTEL